MALSQVGLERLNTATTKKIGTSKNIIINGAMQVAQRGSSSTTAGYQTVDRFVASWSGQDEAPTQAQVDVASGTTPYTLGFRKAFKITNGNQTGGAGASDLAYYEHHIEAQDIASSGWNYTSSSSNITLSFWVKSSVSQDFKGYLRTADGTSQIYPYSTGTLSADTWTKVTKTIPGNSNLQFDNNNESGLQLFIWPYIGTTYTDAGVTENAWTAYASGTRTPVSATTWWTTNDATIEITGVQLEVGSVATDFEHRSFAEELALCQRYYYRWTAGASGNKYLWIGQAYSSSACFGVIRTLPVTMRAIPTASASGTFTPFGDDGSVAGHSAFSSTNIDNNTVNDLATTGWSGGSGISGGDAVVVVASSGSDYIDASAEL